MCAAARSGNSTAARSRGCSPETMASVVGIEAATTDAASMASAITAGRDPTRAHVAAITTPAASAMTGQNSTGSSLDSPTGHSGAAHRAQRR